MSQNKTCRYTYVPMRNDFFSNEFKKKSDHQLVARPVFTGTISKKESERFIPIEFEFVSMNAIQSDLEQETVRSKNGWV